MSDPAKILIIRLSSLGDIVHALPAFQSLRRSFPEARLDWLVERRLAFFLEAVPGIDRIVPIDTHALRRQIARPEAWRLLVRPLREVRAVRYDLAIDFQGLIKTALLCRLSAARVRVGFSRELVRERPAHWGYQRTLGRPEAPAHIVRLNLLLAGVAGATAPGLPIALKAADADGAAVDDRLRRAKTSAFVVLNPGGGWPNKRWPPERYGALADLIRTRLGLEVVVTTGPGEESLYVGIAGACPKIPPLHMPVPFMQLIPLFQRARLVVGGDTGPVHLACALGIPVVAILGPTSPARNGPWSAADEVVVRCLPCSFCHRRACPTATECMDIPVEEVFAGVAKRLGAT